MSTEVIDATGESASIDVVERGAIRSYVIGLADGSAAAGRADFVEDEGAAPTRIFFHTEVDPAFSGRGLAGLVIRTALADAIDDAVVVVPVCPLFAAHLRKHGDAFVGAGGRFRAPRPADLAIVGRAVSGA